MRTVFLAITTRSGRKYSTTMPVKDSDKRPDQVLINEMAGGLEALMKVGGVLTMQEPPVKELAVSLIGVNAGDIESFEVEVRNGGE